MNMSIHLYSLEESGHPEMNALKGYPAIEFFLCVFCIVAKAKKITEWSISISGQTQLID